MSARIRRWFAPPRFIDEEKTRIAALIYGIVLATMGLAVLNMALVILMLPAAMPGLWISILFLVASIGLLTMTRRGYQQAASLILCLFLWFSITFVLFTNEGLMNPNYGAFALVIVVAALLLGARGGLGFTALVFITSLMLLYADINHYVPYGNPPALNINFLISGTVIFISVGVLLTFAVRGIDTALKRARHSENALAEQNQQLQTEVTERRRAEEALRTREETARKFQERLKTLNEVSIELGKIATFDDMCRAAVELGRERLGFDRLGLWFLDPDKNLLTGSFGTDEQGNTRDERQTRDMSAGDTLFLETIEQKLRFRYEADSPLFDHLGKIVGHGWIAQAALWDGDKVVGYIGADNLLNKHPLTDSDLETLTLYGAVLGNLCTRKRAELGLRANEETARKFQNRLKTLAEMNIELAKVATFDDLCRMAVVLGRERLGFDRLGIWFLTDDGQTMQGTFGTDESGNVRDERQERASTAHDELVRRATEQRLRLAYDENTSLVNHKLEVVGRGWNANATLWDGDQVLGWIAADNFLKRESLTDSDLETLTLYGAVLGNLFTRKRAEQGLRASEENARQFQERLKVLNEVNIELANAETFDDLCRCAVELGRGRLGYDRIGCWLWSPDDERLLSAFGTDEQGHTSDERRLAVKFHPYDFEIVKAGSMQTLHIIGEDVPLRDSDANIVGQGWNVMATLWDGKDAVGWLAADNLLGQKPLTSSDVEILKLFSLALANLCARKRTEDKLRNERNLLRTIIDTTPDIVFAKDLQSRFVLVNKNTFVSHAESGQEVEVVGKTDFDFSPPEIASQYHADDQLIFKTGNPIMDKEETGVDAQGNAINLLTSKLPLRDAQGHITGLVGVSRDITPFKRVERALRASEEAARGFQERLKVLYDISLDLARIPTFDELCRAGVELGRERLGFDRLGIWLLDTQPDYTVGSFGTDENGQTRDERGIRLPLTDQYKSILRALLDENNYYFVEDGPIFNDRAETIAVGQKAMAILSDGHAVIGTISMDNLIHHRPITQQDLEILVLYASTLGYLCSRKRAEEALLKERNLLRTIIDILPDRIFVKDTQSRLLLVNKASWMHTPNVNSEEEMIGMTDSDLMPPELAAQIYVDEREVFTSGKPILNREEPGRDYEGKAIYFLSTKVPLRDAQGNIIGLVGVSRDITDQKQAEQQRLDLALQKERLELLTEFIGNMSHDLKTPLSVIKTTLYLMERLNDPVRQEAKLQVIKEQTQRLEKLIQDVITMSRLENGMMPVFQPVDFNTIILDVEAKLRPTVERKHLNIHLNLDPYLPLLNADENELWRLIANLYENALHYTPEHGTITMTTYLADHKVVVDIQDTGIGIGKDDMPHIFDRFYRADPARSLERGGTGLGLAIVKRIVELHHGEIVVQSDEGKGSLFRVYLPIAE